MADELLALAATGLSPVAVIFQRAARLVWSTVADDFVVWNASDIADYGVALTEFDAPGVYIGTIPAAIPSAELWIAIYTSAALATPILADRVSWRSGVVLGLATDNLLADVRLWEGAATVVSKSSAAAGVIATGTVQAATSSTVTLESGAPSTGSFVDAAIVVKEPDGSTIHNEIVGYDGASRVATLEKAWSKTPTTSAVYFITGYVK